MFLTQRAYVIAKLEGTAYTAESPGTTEFDIEVENTSYSHNIAEFQRKLADGTLDTYNSVIGMQSGQVSFSTVMNPGAAVATAPFWNKFLQACGYKAMGWDGGVEKTVALAVEGISWVPHADYTHIPITILIAEIDHDDPTKVLETKLSGCMGNVTFLIGDVGEPVQMNFEFQGNLVSVTDTVTDAVGTVSTVQPPAVLGATVDALGNSQCISKFEINTGNSINLWKCADASTGVKGAYIGSRESILTLDPIADLVANDDAINDWIAGTPGAISIELGSSPLLTLSAPAAQLNGVGRGERDEAVTFEKSFRLHKSATAGNDSFEILQGAKT